MICLTDILPPLPSTVIGCQIQTLTDCYQNLPGFLSLYLSDQGGILCRFEDRLLICGRVDAIELRNFVSMIGIAVIEALEPDLNELDGYVASKHIVLQYQAAHRLPDDGTIKPLANPKCLYDLICQADPNFKSETSYLPWLSDLTLRRKKGCSDLFGIEGVTSACVSAKGCGLGLVSQLVTHPNFRCRGLAAKLLSHICDCLLAESLTPIIMAQNEMLTRFYRRNGFTPCDRYITLRREQKEPPP